jgi:hypothetical protein
MASVRKMASSGFSRSDVTNQLMGRLLVVGESTGRAAG